MKKRMKTLHIVIAVCIGSGLLASCDRSTQGFRNEITTAPTISAQTDTSEPSFNQDGSQLTLDPSKEPPLNSEAMGISVPDFLDEEQQMLYRRAYSLYMHMLAGETSAIEYSEMLDGEFPPHGYDHIELNGTLYLVSQGRYQRWNDFTAVIHSIFTDDFWNDRNCIGAGLGGIYMEHNSALCFQDLSRGGGYYYNDNFPDKFELLEQTDSSISFNLIGHYSLLSPLEGESKVDCDKRLKNGYEYTKKFPIKMVLTTKGWRFDEFHSSLADEGEYEGVLAK